MPHAHVIERLQFEVGFADEAAAWAHAQRVQRFAADQAAAVVAAVFDEVDDGDTVVTLAEVEVDLGVLAADASDEAWAECLREALRRVMDIGAGARPPGAASAVGRSTRPRAASDRERLWAWLQHGRLPWQADPMAEAGDAIDTLAARVLAEQGEALAQTLQKAPERRRLLERIALQWPRPLRARLARWWTLPAEAMAPAHADATERQRWLQRALAAVERDQAGGPAERGSADERLEPASVDEHRESQSANERPEAAPANEGPDAEPADERVRRTRPAVSADAGPPVGARALDAAALADALAQVLSKLAADEPQALADTCRRLALPLAQWRRVVRQLPPAARVALVRAMAPTDTAFVLALPTSVVLHAGAANELAHTTEAWAFVLQHLSQRPPGQALARGAMLDALLRHLAASESHNVDDMRRALAAALASPTLRQATPPTLRSWLEAVAAADAIGGTARPEGGGDADAAEAQASIQRRTRLDAQLRQARLAAADPAWLLATQLDDAWLLERLRHWAGDAHWRQVFAARLTLRQWREWLASRLAPADAERALARLADAAAATVAPTTTAGAPPAAFAAALLEASLRDDAGSDAAEEDVDAPWRASAAAAPDQPDATGISVRPRPPAQGTTSATAAATAPPTEPTAAVASQLQGEIRHAAGPARDHTGMDDMAVMAGIPGIADVADVASVADVADVAGAATAPPQSRAVPALPESPWAEALAATARCLDLLAGACAAAGLGLDASAVRRVGTRVLAAAVVAGPQGFALARLVEAWFAALPQAGLGLAPPASAAPAARSASAARWRQALAQALALGSRSVPRQPVAHAAPPATTPAAAAAVAQGPHTPGPPQAAAPPAGAPRVAPSPARAEHARDVLAADTAALQARLAALLAAATPAPNGRAVTRDAAAAARVPAAAEMPAIDERSEALYLANAGLVLAGPYLPRLLSRLGLLAGERFVDDAAARRAVQVLQVVVDGRRETPEHALVLNKLLCGWPQAMPVAREITLDDAEERAITGMLEAMIKHWGALGKTSVAGLRQSFLQREGVLTRSDEGWRLLVQPRPYDMLLDRLLWGFRTIKYPWMEQVLHVDWR